MKRAVLIRLKEDKKQTLGRLFLFDGLSVIFESTSLELANNDNQRNISCIPTGSYNVKSRNSKKYNDHFIIEDVPDRDFILIHPANFHTDLRGCIGIGKEFADINADNRQDITQSRATMKKLLQIAPEGFNLIVLDNLPTLES